VIGARPTLLPVSLDTDGSFPGVKLLEREAYHSSPSSAELKNTWCYTSTPPYIFIA
jgi:hypothetical protein